MNIRIEGLISDADQGCPVKDLVVRLVQDRSILCTYLTGKDGRYLLEAERKKPGCFEIEIRDSEGMDRYASCQETVDIDTLPFFSRVDFSLRALPQRERRDLG